MKFNTAIILANITVMLISLTILIYFVYRSNSLMLSSSLDSKYLIEMERINTRIDSFNLSSVLYTEDNLRLTNRYDSIFDNLKSAELYLQSLDYRIYKLKQQIKYDKANFIDSSITSINDVLPK